MLKNKWLEGLGVGTLVFGGVSLMIFISPLVAVFFGWLAGLVLMWITGSFIPNGLNLLLDTERFTRESLPMITATLAVVGSYFKSTQTNKNK